MSLPLNSEPEGLGISRLHPDFVRFVNAVLARMRGDGQWAASYARWIGTSVPAPPRPGTAVDRMTTMKLTSHLPPADRERVEGRLRSNLIAWLTTVRPDGQPVTVPVWFLLRDDETILLYSGPQKEKLRNIAANPKVSFALDVTDIGRNIVRFEGTARRAHDQPPASEHPGYLAKYTERMAAMFGTPEQFAMLFSAAVIITPVRLHT